MWPLDSYYEGYEGFSQVLRPEPQGIRSYTLNQAPFTYQNDSIVGFYNKNLRKRGGLGV